MNDESGQPRQVSRDAVVNLLKNFFRPEFLNRVDEIVTFKPLTREDLGGIVEIQLRHVSDLLADRGLKLEISTAAREWLADVGYDPEFGARPLKRAIQREVQDPLALRILSGDFRAEQASFACSATLFTSSLLRGRKRVHRVPYLPIALSHE
jgi:ATP-dependent Clp protease ATP-binding subunit ClpB